MEEFLLNHGFVKDEETNNWCREGWVIRLFEKKIEAYQELSDKHPARYAMMEPTMEYLELLMHDIEGFIRIENKK